MTLALLADGIENPANRARIDDAARMLGAARSPEISGSLIAIENCPGAASIYGRAPLQRDATLAVGHERRGLSARMLARADEVLRIPTVSRRVNTLNVAAAAAVAGWYVLRGSGRQKLSTSPDLRRPSLLIVGVGDDHVEVGSTLRSAAAFGFRDVFLEDRGAGWFDGPSWARREAYAAARRHKNAIFVHRATLAHTAMFSEVVAVLPWGCERPVQREALARGTRQLVVVGASASDIAQLGDVRVRTVSLGLEPSVQTPPLRLTSSIVLAEIARQVGARKRVPPPPTRRLPTYDTALAGIPLGEVALVEDETLLDY